MTKAVLGEAAEERLELEEAIALGIADLSSVETAPTGVDVRMSFEPDEVQFGGTAWLDYIMRIQDWLHLITPIRPEDAPTVAAVQLFEGMGYSDVASAVLIEGDTVLVTNKGLDFLRGRVDRAVDLKNKFLDAVDSASHEAASSSWTEDWDGAVEETISGPILAQSIIWNINDFASRAQSGRLELSPSYQRGDVWPIADAQKLVESILRGIPLPSIIILRPNRGGDAPYEVVDGKQRLTAILRFIGAHPRALEIVKAAAAKYPEQKLEALFESDYSKFRQAWKNATGETLSSALEREYYFPFKLSSTSQALTGDLSAFQGQYYHAIMDLKVTVGGERMRAQDVFKLSTGYKIPVIEYTEATPRQVHEVFNLYNKQGKHLNAEEIRNAVYHELDLMRALSVAAGDNEDLTRSAPFLLPVTVAVDQIRQNLSDYRFGDARYRRTKVLSWLVSLLLADDLGADGRPRMRSTSQQIDLLLETVQKNSSDPLQSPQTIANLITLVSKAMNAHAASDAWADKFKDAKSGARWQELQLVASLLGVTIATVALNGSIEEVLIDAETGLREATSSKDWARPEKTQTGTQWEFIAGVATAIASRLGVSMEDVDNQLRGAFGRSGIPALLAARDTSIS